MTLDLTVMTWNIYLGADVAPVIGAPRERTAIEMTKAWETAQATDFRIRARAIATEVVRRAPDVVSLQEVYRWTTIERRSLDQGRPSVTLVFDFLAILLGALDALGATYFVAAESRGVKVRLPTVNGPDVQMEDSVVTLVRAGRGAKPLTWDGTTQGRYSTNLRAALYGEPFDVGRGWVAVDLALGGTRVRIVNTHLEAWGETVRAAQVRELLDGPARREGALLLTGDFNCTPDSDTWHHLRDAGYRDVWTPADETPGFTSCHDADLRNDQSKLYERIDWILCRGVRDVHDVALTGCERSADGMWPSDHAGVVATIELDG